MNDIFAGGACSILSIAYALSYAALIFSGPLAPFLGDGIAITLLGAAVMAVVVALRSSVPTMVAGAEGSISAVIATIAALVAGSMLAAGHQPAALLAPTLLALMGVTAIAGILMIALARVGGGRAMRYVPYPVIGGFLGATGWLIISGAVHVITDHSLSLSSWAWLSSSTTLAQLAAGLAFGAAAALAMRNISTIYALPVVLAGGVLAAHGVFWACGLSLHDAQASGWTFASQQARAPWEVLSEIGSAAFGPAALTWHIAPALAGDALAAVLVTAVSALVNVTAVEVATQREADLENELKVIGWANIASAAVGSYAGSASISRTVLNEKAGATGRMSGLTVALITAAAVLVGPALLGYLPKFVIGGLLLYLGADQLYRWTLVSWRRLSRTEYVSLLAIIVITANFGFVYGLIIGTVIGCATFAYSASRISSIKFEFDGSELRSTLDRDRDELAILATRGAEIVGLNLQSYLFFGSANRLYSHIKKLLADRTACRYLVFDFRLVTGLDSSAVHSFTQIKRHAEARGVGLVLVHLPRKTEAVLRSQPSVLKGVKIMTDLDHALEWCEDQVIRAHQPGEAARGDLLAWFTDALRSPAFAEDLLARCRRIDVETGAVLAKAGDEANSMYFIAEGRIAVMVGSAGGRDVRVRSLGRHTMVGEMGLLASQPRSATLIAEVRSVFYELDADALAALKAENPPMVEKLLTYVVAVMAERLAYANRAIGLLRR